MKEQIQRFLDYIAEEKGYSENTLAAYSNDLSQFATFLEKRVAGWAEVDETLILEYITYMKAEQEYASSTVARKVAAIKSFFHYLAEQGEIPDDPTATLDSPKALRDRALLEVLYATGLRVTELVSLNVDDVNLASSTARVVQSRGRKPRLVPIHQRAIEPLQDYLERGRVPLLRDPEEQALFVNHRGQRLTRQGLWLIVKHYAREAGTSEPVTPHTLRHSFAAHLLDKKAELEYVQELLGHANISTTQVYTQVTGDEVPGEGIAQESAPQ
jgi:integrase/recombinase XerD